MQLHRGDSGRQRQPAAVRPTGQWIKKNRRRGYAETERDEISFNLCFVAGEIQCYPRVGYGIGLFLDASVRKIYVSNQSRYELPAGRVQTSAIE